MTPANSLEESIRNSFGENISITAKTAIYGGDINRAYCLSLSNGQKAFLKANRPDRLHMFETEANGLRALSSSGTVKVPALYACGRDQSNQCAFLLMEYIEQGTPDHDYWEKFGRDLALFHRTLPDLPDMGKTGNDGNCHLYGFYEDNYIGSTLQKNTQKESFLDFYRECRLKPQIHMAEKKLPLTTRKKLDHLLDHLDRYMAEPEFPSLVHGDLWSGNAMCSSDGHGCIYDPAVYIGHFEADLAMSQMFGGFPAPFYEAYHEVNPIDPEYKDRRALYDLYQMLNHLNLFGGGYLYNVEAIVNSY